MIEMQKYKKNKKNKQKMTFLEMGRVILLIIIEISLY